MRSELDKILTNVNDWLKFAETKNAGLVAFNCAAIAGIMQAYPTDKPDLVIYKGIMIALFALSICISIYTFLPVLNRTFNYQKIDDTQFEVDKLNLNCYFFKHHSKINCQQLLRLLEFKIGNSVMTTSIELDIADQIINNSEIALSKFRLFTWSAYVTFVGVFVGLIVLILNLF